MELVSVDVWMTIGNMESYVSASPQEAFAMMSMPALAGVIVRLVPCYALSSVPEPEDKD